VPKPTSHGDRSGGLDEPSFLVFATTVAGPGGIPRATRTLIEALVDLWGRERVRVFSVWANAGAAPPASHKFWAATEPTQPSGRVPLRARAAYLVAGVKAAHQWRHQRLVVIACHVELAPVAWAAAWASGARYAVWCHGREAWGRLGLWVRLSLGRASLRIERISRRRRGRLEVRVQPAGQSRPTGHKWGAPHLERAGADRGRGRPQPGS
jgi:hypothetical protein